MNKVVARNILVLGGISGKFVIFGYFQQEIKKIF